LWIPLKEGIGGRGKEAQRQDEERVTFRIILIDKEFYNKLKLRITTN
jgi:hypothetical protein